MVEAQLSGDDELPTILIVNTPATSETKDRIIDALKLKQGDTVDVENKTWEIVTNYYRAKVKFEQIELPFIAQHMLDKEVEH